MRRFVEALVVVLAFTTGAALAQAPAPAITGAQLTTGFKKATGDKLVVNRKSTYPGHYKAYDLGVPSIARKARYGTFTVYLVSGAAVEADVTDLLADGHTGVLGERSPGNIYWESGTTVFGDVFWMAKRQYAGNVVVWWIGSKPVKKTDASWKRLHTALTKVTR